MKLELPAINGLQKLARLFNKAGFRLYAVGGIVRNTLLSLPPSDLDICSGALPDQVMELLREEPDFKIIPKAVEFGTVEIHYLVQGRQIFEHTTFRGDSYGEGGTHRPDSVSFESSLEEDAFRRDFTVNAIYCDLLTGEIHDPTGGLADIENHLIRTTSPDPHKILSDDGLRILRLVRFACELGFDIELLSFEAAQNMAELIEDIAAERCRDEFNKLLLSDIRYQVSQPGNEKAHHRGLKLLDQLGVLTRLIPELELCRGVEQKAEYHAFDVFDHSIMVCVCAPPSLELRLSGLLHDVGKPVAVERSGKMYGHDRIGAQIAKDVLCRLRYPNALIETVVMLISNHMYDLNGKARESTIRKKACTLGKIPMQLLSDIREADVLGSGRISGPVETAEKWRAILHKMELEQAPFSEKELNATGSDIMKWLGIGPSPQVGKIKNQLLMHCAIYPKHNSKAFLKQFVESMK